MGAPPVAEDRPGPQFSCPIATEGKYRMEATSRDPLPWMLLILTATTGLVDAVSYLGLGHVFTANLTGNVVLLGFALVGSPDFLILPPLVSLGGFLIGAAGGGRLGVVVAGASRRTWLGTAFAVEVTLLLLAASCAPIMVRLGAGWPQLAIIAATAAAMGLRNATVRRLAVPDLTTTVLTLTLTGLAADSRLAGGSSPRQLRRLGATLALILGAAIGALLTAYGIALPLLVTAACVGVAAALYIAHPGSMAPAKMV
jgi:uncharacterized membrane protein YoaK (UPF0700 family)